MTINKNLKDGVLNVALSGRLDTTTAPQLESELSYDGVTELIFDLTDLEYVSSAGLRVILGAQKQMLKQGGLKLRNVNEAIMEVFEITGFADIFNIEK